MSAVNAINATSAVTATTALGVSNAAINSAAIADGSVSLADLSANSVDSSRIENGSIGTIDLADDAVTTVKLAANAVDGTRIANGAVATADLADDAVTSAKLADNSVASINIVDGTVGDADLSLAFRASVSALDDRLAALEAARPMLARIGGPGAGIFSVCSSSPCTVQHESVNFITSVTRQGRGVYDITYNTAFVSDSARCVITTPLRTCDVGATPTSLSTTNLDVRSFDQNTTIDTVLDVTCFP